MARHLRRHRRVAIDLGGSNGSLRLRDLSICGARALWSEALRIDESIELDLPVGGSSLTLRGVVVRARRTGLAELPFEYGIELEPLSPTSHERLLLFMDQHGVAEEPTSEVNAGQLQELQERIAELESQLATAVQQLPNQVIRTRVPGARQAAVPAQENRQPADHLQTTRFEAARFIRLLQIGQPLLPLISQPPAGLEDQLQRAAVETLAAAGEDCLDLNAISRRLRGFADQDSIIEALLACYQQSLIDFA